MNRDFLRLNLDLNLSYADPEEVKEQDPHSAFPKSSVSDFTFPKLTQDEKMEEADITSGAMGLSNGDTLDKGKRLMAEPQSDGDGQAGNQVSMAPNCTLELSASPVHPSVDVTMFPAANQSNSTSMTSPFLETYSTGVASPTQQSLGASPVASPPSVITSTGSAGGMTEPWVNSNSSGGGQPANLTMVYEDKVYVFEEVYPEQAEAIMFLAAHASEDMGLSDEDFLALATKVAGEHFMIVDPNNTMPTYELLDSVSAPPPQPVDPSATNGEVTETPDTSMPPLEADAATTTMEPRSIDQCRKASLIRFLERRKRNNEPAP